MRRTRAPGHNKGRALGNWEGLVQTAVLYGGRLGEARQGRGGAAARRQQRDDELGRVVPPSLGQGGTSEININDILQAPEEIQPDDPQVARILCEYAYNMAQNLDPESEGRGVLQFKTGLLSVIRQKQSKKEGERIDRSNDIQCIQRFYYLYRRKHQIDELERMERDGASLHEDPVEHKWRMQKMRKVYRTSRILNIVLNALTRDSTQEEMDSWISKELKDQMETDANKIAEFKPYNILPLETPVTAETIMTFEEVTAGVASLEHTRDLPDFPEEYRRPEHRKIDIFDVLEYIFGFQEGNVNNQREHLVLSLANRQSMLGLPTESLKLDDDAINVCFKRLLDNYVKWCEYLRMAPITERAETGQRKLMLMALYLLIWGEAANLRFLPECLCYIFHNMADELFSKDLLSGHDLQRSKTYRDSNEKDGKQYSFLEQVISPIYQTMLAEAKSNKGGKASHASWRNYDDFNEFFWSQKCFVLGWPWRLDAGFFVKPRKKGVAPDDGKVVSTVTGGKKEKRISKMTFVEHRSFVHMYHSFHRLWIFFTVMLQAMMVVAFCHERLNTDTFKKMLSVGPTYLIMKSVQSVFDLLFIYGGYASTRGWSFSRIFARLLFYCALATIITLLYVKMIQENTRGSASTWYNLYLIVLGSYAGAQLLPTVVLRVPVFRRLTDRCANWSIIRFVFWIHQDRYFVGLGLYERNRDYLGYSLFWVFVLACKFAFSYHFQIKSLVDPTQTIVKLKGGQLRYKWHDVISENNHNALTVASIWVPVIMIYYLDTQVWYTVMSAIVGGIVGARERLGEIRSLDMLRKRFSTFPEETTRILVPSRGQTQQMTRSQSTIGVQAGWSKNKIEAVKFAPLWNEIIKSLREEDYINNREKELLLMPANQGHARFVQWPLFLLANKVLLAVEMAEDNKSASQIQLWERIEKDQYMAYAVHEAYNLLEAIMKALLVNDEAKTWVRSVFGDVEVDIQENVLVGHFHLRQVDLVLTKIRVLLALLIHPEDDISKRKAVVAMQGLYETVMHDFLSVELREKFESWTVLTQAKNSGQLFANLKWPETQEQKDAVRRLQNLLTIIESSANIPRNLEARRRLQFFTNSLFMNMPVAPSVRKMLSFSVFTPYYAEDVMYSKERVRSENEDGISMLFYLQTIFPDEWKNFLERVGFTHKDLMDQLEVPKLDMLELQLWASFRGQTLARTVRGMMYYKKALVLASLLEGSGGLDLEEGLHDSHGEGDLNFRYHKARAEAEMKFTYVVSCQKYGAQKQQKDMRAADIAYLMKTYESLRIAYIDTVETLKDGRLTTVYYSKLLKADIDGNDQEIYSVRLPGDFILGEGKPENQNHAIIFTRGDALQTIDMNQDNSFEEAFKMRNLLEEFKAQNCERRPSILGIRENVFTRSVSSLAWFMSQQEGSFVTLGQRVLACPLKVRMHYGHPDVFDRIFHITRGGISKASKTINISEDIFAGFNSTLRQGNVTHHEYIQVGKGRDVGLNQISIFEAKVSGGNGEQILSRDVFRLGQLFDFFRMLSFFYTSVGYYITTLMTTLVVYFFLYGKCYLAVSGLDEQLREVADISGNAAISSALSTQLLLQIGVFTAIPMIVNFVLELGVLKAVISFVTMQLQLQHLFCVLHFLTGNEDPLLWTDGSPWWRQVLGHRTRICGATHSLCRKLSSVFTKSLYKSLILLGAMYSWTSFQRPESLWRWMDQRIFEIVALLIVHRYAKLAYGSDNSGITYVILSFSSWFLAISWLFAPYIFNPSGFEWQKTVEDFDDWTNWLFYKGGVSVKGAESYESWLEEEQVHIKTWRGRIFEILLSVRFFLFQYGVVYALNVSGSTTSLAVYGYSWIVFAGLVVLYKVFTITSQASINFQLFLRLFQGVLFLGCIAAVVVCIVLTSLTVGDCFAILLAFVPTGWGLLCAALAIKPFLEELHVWGFFLSAFRMSDAIMGGIIFLPIAFLSLFPFVSTFQTRLVFNQAFSRGLEISLILAGNRPNAST